LRRIFLFCFYLLVSGLACGLGEIVDAQTPPEGPREKAERELDKIKQQLDDRTNRIDSLTQQEQSAHRKTRSLREEMELLDAVSTRLARRDRNLNRQLNASEIKVEDFTKARMYREEVLSRVVRRLYVLKTASDIPENTLGSADGLRRRRFGQLVSQNQALLTKEIGDSLATWEGRHVELAQTHKEVKNAAAGKEKEKNRKGQQLAKAEREAFSYRQQREQEFDELENIQREAMILSDLIERLAALPSAQGGIDYDFPGWKGRLYWPLTGEVKSTVGRKIDPKYKTETYETGMFIAGTTGLMVVNAADGEVAFTGRRKGLGNVVIVGHGSGYFSIFAHLEDISVITGTMLRAGEQVGTAGDSHPRFGTGILFELRHNRDVLDPLEWLR